MESGFVKADDDRQFEEQIRPPSLDQFIGQSRIKENLSVAVRSARKRSDAVDHILFCGLPGVGKTTLSRIIANEMGTKLVLLSGPILKRPADLVSCLTQLEKGDVLFIDEIHRIAADVEEYLYSAMEDFFIVINVEKGVNGKTVKIPLKKFTLIGATTREALLSEPFRSRFVIVERLEPYPAEDLVQIIKRDAKILRIGVDKEASDALARRARGIPRIAIRFLKRARDFACVSSQNKIDSKIASTTLEKLEVDDEGLESLDRKILQVLADHNGEPIGLKTISAAINESAETIEEIYEPYLIQKGYLVKTNRGRKPTDKCLKRFGKGTTQTLFQ